MDPSERMLSGIEIKFFLPAMAKYKAWMATYDGPELKRCDLILQPGEQRIIAQFQDESCLHANNQPSSYF